MPVLPFAMPKPTDVRPIARQLYFLPVQTRVPLKFGPTSTITGAFIVNAIIVGGIEHALKLGHTPEVFISSNTNGDEHNDRILQKYKSRVRHL